MNTRNYDINHKPDVFKGHRFAISCSPGSLYKPFSIRLRYQVDGNKDAEWIQTGVEDAIFLFPTAEDAHKRFYKCDYNYEIRPEVFSDSKSLYVTVEGKPELITSRKVSNLLSIQCLTFSSLIFKTFLSSNPNLTLTLTQYLLPVAVLS